MGRKDRRDGLGFKIHNRTMAVDAKKSIAAKLKEENVHDRMTVSTRDVEELATDKWAFVRRIEKRSGCKIQIPPQSGEAYRVISFTGSKEVVFKAKEKVKKVLTLYSVPT